MGWIKLENIRIHANHGCMAEETIIGSDYRVDVAVEANLERSSKTDSLSDTVDYVTLNKIVVEEMSMPHKLLEVVAEKIICNVLRNLPMVIQVKVAVSKINPPINGDVEKVTVVLQKSR